MKHMSTSSKASLSTIPFPIDSQGKIGKKGSIYLIDSESFVVEQEMLSQANLKTGITKPHPHDVLSGRSNDITTHPGNQYFRSLVNRLKNEYVMSEKSDKPVFAKYIFKHIRVLDPPGRFLKKNGEHWEDMGKRKTMDKIRQALREGAEKVKNEIESGKRSVKTSVRRSITSYNAPKSLLTSSTSSTSQSTTESRVSENRSKNQFTSMSEKDFGGPTNLLNLSNSIIQSLNQSVASSSMTHSMHSMHHSSQSLSSSDTSQRNNATSIRFENELISQKIRLDLSNDSCQFNDYGHPIKFDNSVDSKPHVPNEYYNPSFFMNQSSYFTNRHITKVPAKTIQPKDSITMYHEALVSNPNNNHSSVGPVLKHKNGSTPSPIASFANSRIYSQQNLRTLEEESGNGMNYSFSSNHIATHHHNNARNERFKGGANKIEAEEDDGEDGFEEFPGGNTEEDDGEEEFPGGSETFGKDLFPLSFHDFDNNQEVALTDSFRGSEYNAFEASKRHSLYHPDLDRICREEGIRRSSLVLAGILENDLSKQLNNDEEEQEGRSKRKFNDINRLRDSLMNSLVITQEAKKIDRRRSQRLSALLRQSLLSLGSTSDELEQY